MKEKINEFSLLKNVSAPKSDLYTRYKYAFDRLLPLKDIRSDQEKQKLYIHDYEVEEELNYLIDDIQDTISVLFGYAGIGKSTLLRYCLDFYNSSATFWKGNKEILVFPATFNSCLSEFAADPTEEKYNAKMDDFVKKKLALRILSVCTYLERQFVELKQMFDSQEGQYRFFEYVSETVPSALEYLPNADRIGLSEDTERRLKLEYMDKEDSYVYAASKLKFYLSSNLCECNKLIIVLDDIEPLPYDYQFALVMQYLRFFDCMKNRATNSADKNYIVNLVVALRPHTYRILQGKREFQSYVVTRKILKKNMVDLSQLFERKIALYKDKIPHKEKDKWVQACKILNILCNKFNSKYKKQVESLAVFNTRDAIQIFKEILENRVWVQNNMEKKPAFSLEEEKFIFNNVTIPRAIACGNFYIYKNVKDCFIPNIMRNTIDKDYTFLNLCVLSLFNGDKDYLYGKNNISYREIKEKFFESFPEYNDLNYEVENTISFLFSVKILRKSIDDVDDVETLDKKESLTEDSIFYLSPKGFEIINMLSSDCTYMEICREDYYRDYSQKKMCNKSSFELLQLGQEDLIYEDLFKILFELLEFEENYVRYTIQNNSIKNYVNSFGRDIKCKKFYYGIAMSIGFSKNKDNKRIKFQEKKVQNKISDIENLIEDALKC